MNKRLPSYFALIQLLFITICLPGFSEAASVAEKEKSSPDQPILVQPINQSNGNPTGITLSVMVSDPEMENLSVTFYGRKKLSATDDFTIVGLPDTQYYTGQLYDGTPEIFYSQTQWIVDNMETENIVFVSQLGDCVENGDLVEDEWKIADTAMKKIEDPITTTLLYGLPYAIAVGNHDQTPDGDPNGTTALFNAYFGESRFFGRQYYGGHYGSNNDNSFQFFNAGGMDFMVINIEFDPAANYDVLSWADSLLTVFSDHRAIIVSHFLIGPGNPGSFGFQGQAIYNQFKDNPNVFLMLGAHFPGEGQRTDIYNGDTIHTLLADYQNRANGGDGWLRLMRFSPANNSISVKTYSPWLHEWEQDADSEFELSYNMEAAGIDSLGTIYDVSSGTQVNVEWPDLDPNTEYEWYVEVTDGNDTIRGLWWSFTTGDHLLNVKVFLEGPFNENDMLTGLTEIIPFAQPYSGPPWNYNGAESVTEIPPDVVDWVLIELRDATDAISAFPETAFARQAAFLLNNGSVVGIDGQSILAFNHLLIQSFFILVWHRNHLEIMSADPLLNTAGVFNYDFTNAADKTHGAANGCSELPNNFWGMIAGDSNADGHIDTTDKTGWDIYGGYASYLLNDLNLDRQTDNQDKNDYWQKNLGRSSLVPE